MRFRGLLLITALLPVLACGGGGSSDGSGISSGSEAVTPGAQQVPAGDQQLPPGTSMSSPAPRAPAAEAATEAAVEPASMIVDVENRRIFLPDEGWLSPEGFWDLYYHHADRLPGGIDFDAVNRLGPMPPAPAAEP